MSKKTARRIKDTNHRQVLWEVCPPLCGYGFIVTSQYEDTFDMETYIFPSDPEGKIIDWGELPGSYKGGLDHNMCIEKAGYRII